MWFTLRFHCLGFSNSSLLVSQQQVWQNKERQRKNVFCPAFQSLFGPLLVFSVSQLLHTILTKKHFRMQLHQSQFVAAGSCWTCCFDFLTLGLWSKAWACKAVAYFPQQINSRLSGGMIFFFLLFIFSCHKITRHFYLRPGEANKEARVKIKCSLEILKCVAGKPKLQTDYTFFFFFFGEHKLRNLLEFVELPPTLWMAYSISLFIRLCCSTPPESKQLFLDCQ